MSGTSRGFSLMLCTCTLLRALPEWSTLQRANGGERQARIYILPNNLFQHISIMEICLWNETWKKTWCTTVLGWLSLRSSGGSCGPVTPLEETELGQCEHRQEVRKGQGPAPTSLSCKPLFSPLVPPKRMVTWAEERQDRANNTQNGGWGI